MILGISYSDIFRIVTIVLFFWFSWDWILGIIRNIMFLRFFNGFLGDGGKEKFQNICLKNINLNTFMFIKKTWKIKHLKGGSDIRSKPSFFMSTDNDRN